MLICRRPQAVRHAQFWAEDGSVFFADQLRFGFWHALVTPYAGYLLAVPRIVAALISLFHFKIVRLPSVYGLCAIILAAFCCSAFSWPSFRWLISSDAVRAAACLLVASAVPVGSELIGSLCDLNWYMPPVALLLLFTDWEYKSAAARKVTETAACAALWIMGLSAPVLFVTAPLLLWQVIRVPVRQLGTIGWRRWKAFALMLALGIQYYVLKHTGSGLEQHHINFNSLVISTVAAVVAKGILGPLFGTTFLGAAGTVNSIMTKLILTLIISVSLLTLFFVYLRVWPRRVILLTALYVGVSAVAVAIIGRDLYGAFLSPTAITSAEGHRYFFVPGWMFVFIAALAADYFLSVFKPRPLKLIAPALLLLVFSAGIVRNFRTPPLVDLAWPARAAEIEKWLQAQQRHEPVADLPIPLNPPPFDMRLVPRDRR